MDAQYASRKQQLLAECHVAPEIFHEVMPRVETFLLPFVRTFGDVPTGGLVANLGSGGQVEVAVRDGSAARRLGMGVGGRIRARLG